MSIYKLVAAFAALALGAAVVLGFPALSPDVEAGLPAPAVKTDRIVTPEQAKPEPAKLEQIQPEPVKPQQIQPPQAKPEPPKPEQSKPELSKPEQLKPQQVRPQQGKVRQAKQAKPDQGEPRPTAKAKRCADDTWAHYEMKCQKTRTRVVNGVRTTRIIRADPQSQE